MPGKRNATHEVRLVLSQVVYILCARHLPAKAFQVRGQGSDEVLPSPVFISAILRYTSTATHERCT